MLSRHIETRLQMRHGPSTVTTHHFQRSRNDIAHHVYGRHVTFVQCLCNSLIGDAAAAINLSERPQNQREKAHCRNAVVLTKPESQFAISLAVVNREHTLCVLPRADKIALKPTSHPVASVGNAGWRQFWLTHSVPQERLCNFPRGRKLGTGEATNPRAIVSRESLGCVLHLGRKITGASKCGGCSVCMMTLRGDQCVSLGDLQTKPCQPGIGFIGKTFDQTDGLVEMRYRFGERGAAQRQFAGLTPPSDCSLRQPGFSVVPRNNPRLARSDIAKLGLKCHGNASVKLLPPSAQQGAIGGILHQCVLETVLRIGGYPSPENQLGGHQLRERAVELLLWHSRNRADHFMLK